MARPSTMRERPCANCGVCFLVAYDDRKYCSDSCRRQASTQRRKARICSHCGASCLVGRATCSTACLQARRFSPRRPRKAPTKRGADRRPLRAHIRPCDRCGETFISKRITTARCKKCVQATAPWRRNRDHGKAKRKAMRSGAAFERGITPDKVFTRDGWRCQLCGCKTPKRLRGLHRPVSPEVDHIVPFAAGGGHTWDNVQCACRQCNGKKNAKPLGQLRLAV